MRTLEQIAAEFRAAGLDGEPLAVAVALVHGAELVAQPIKLIAEGDAQTPTGLEGVAMAVGGEGLHDSLARSIRAHAEPFRRLADVLEALVKNAG